MQKSFWLFVLLVLLNTNAEAQQKKADYNIQKYLISIDRMTPEAVEEINKVKRKTQRSIHLDRNMSQEDFDRVCEAFDWIRELNIYGNEQIDNISAISNLDSLKVLSLTHLKKTRKSPLDLQPLANLTSLNDINFQGTHLKDTEPLNNLVSLQKINFDFSDVSSISFLCNTPKVKELILIGSGHTFENYNPITCLKELEILNVYHNEQATDEYLDTLKVLTRLKEFTIHYNREVTTLEFLKNNLELEVIDASYCYGIKDFSVLPRFKNLKVLALENTKFEDINVLEGLVKLERLIIPGTKVKDLSPLNKMTKLTHLYISSTGVKDISVLENCLDLETLKMSNSSIADITPLFNCRELLTLNVNIYFRGRPFDFYKNLDSLKTLNPDIKIKKD